MNHFGLNARFRNRLLAAMFGVFPPPRLQIFFDPQDDLHVNLGRILLSIYVRVAHRTLFKCSPARIFMFLGPTRYSSSSLGTVLALYISFGNAESLWYHSSSLNRCWEVRVRARLDISPHVAPFPSAYQPYAGSTVVTLYCVVLRSTA